MESPSGAGGFVPLGDFLTAEEPVWVWDAADRRILWANKAGRDFWGADSLDALRAKRFDARNKSARRMAALAEQPGNGREWIENLTLPAASGRRLVTCYMQNLQIAGGRPGLIVKALNDAKGRDRSAIDAVEARQTVPPGEGPGAGSDQAALNAIAARLKKSGKQRAEALPATAAPDVLSLQIREMCHELRNPLTVIQGFAERIRDVAPPGKKQEQLRGYAGDILESAHLAMAVLADFAARILRPGSEPPRPEPAAIGATVESCLRLIAPLAKQAGLRISRRVARDLPALLVGERVLKQILLNLLMNAVRHQKTGGKIVVTARRRKQGAVRLAVADDGKGMTKKEIHFVMATERRKSPSPVQPGGSGLGLPLVRRLVEIAGGRLAIESARGKGTTVEIIFPGEAV